MEDKQLLASFLSNERCQIEELALHEADLEDEIFQVMIESLKTSNKLERLSLAKNDMNKEICQDVLKLTRGHS